MPADTFAASEPQLWIYNPLTLGGPGLRRDALVWRMDVEGQAAGDPVRELVLIDARIGAVALNFNQIAHGKDRRVCDSENVPDTEPFANYECVSERYDREEGQPPTGVADVDRAYDQHGAVYDYYLTNFNRDSIDDQGLPLLATVRYCPAANDPANPLDNGACPFPNAFWDGEQMTYGDGFIVDDVVAHELTHGVTSYESNLFYYYQSGAINESLSDVFGELFDLQYAPGGNDAPDVRWDIGEDLPNNGAIRDMQDPPRFGDPDRVGSSRYFTRQGDQGGVHTNSGVNNKAAYLMTDGGTFNGQTIQGIDARKTGSIYYVANTQYLLSASDYQDLADILPQACDVLAQSGIAITTAADCVEVRKAVLATEMNQTPRATTAEAPVCGAGQVPANVFFDDLENTNSGNWVSAATQPNLSPINAWFYPQSSAPPPISIPFGTSYATSGVNNFWGYNYGGFPGLTPPEQLVPADYNIAMTRDVDVPANVYMHFRHAYDFDASLFGTYDGGVVEYSTDGGQTYQDVGALFTDNGYNGDLAPGTDNLLAGRAAFVDRSKGYTSSRADLGSLAGKNVRFRFRIGTDSTSADYGWFIDDIRIYTCGASYTDRVFMPMIP